MTDPAPIPLSDWLIAAALALGGLVLAWALQGVLPEGLRPAANGAITGGFGVLAATRLWPGLPMRKLPWWVGSMVAYGVAVALVARI